MNCSTLVEYQAFQRVCSSYYNLDICRAISTSDTHIRCIYIQIFVSYLCPLTPFTNFEFERKSFRLCVHVNEAIRAYASEHGRVRWAILFKLFSCCIYIHIIHYPQIICNTFLVLQRIFCCHTNISRMLHKIISAFK